MLQVPDPVMKTEEKIDTVVLDDDAVGAPDGVGSGAKVLRGEGALDVYLNNTKSSSKVIEHHSLILIKLSILSRSSYLNSKPNTLYL